MARFRSSDIKCFRSVQVLDDGRVLERTPNYGPKVYSITVWPDATMEQYEYRTHGYDTPSAAKRAVVDYLNAYPRTSTPEVAWCDLKGGETILCPGDGRPERVVGPAKKRPGGFVFVRTARHDHCRPGAPRVWLAP